MNDLLQDAVARIDASNCADPNQVSIRGTVRPLALVHGQLATEWINHLVADPADELIIAARAHHLRRWELPRSTYPEGRAGYLRWRQDQKARHCGAVGDILTSVGYPAGVIDRVQELIRNKGRASGDDDFQALEDASCLVFLETQLAAMSERLDRPHLIEVIRKTARKMSPDGVAAIDRIDLGETEKALLGEAFA